MEVTRTTLSFDFLLGYYSRYNSSTYEFISWILILEIKSNRK